MPTKPDPDRQAPASPLTEGPGKRPPGTLLSPPPSSLPQSIHRSHEPPQADSGAPPGRRGGGQEEEGAHSEQPTYLELPHRQGGREKRRGNRLVTSE